MNSRNSMCSSPSPSLNHLMGTFFFCFFFCVFFCHHNSCTYTEICIGFMQIFLFFFLFYRGLIHWFCGLFLSSLTQCNSLHMNLVHFVFGTRHIDITHDKACTNSLYTLFLANIHDTRINVFYLIQVSVYCLFVRDFLLSFVRIAVHSAKNLFNLMCKTIFTNKQKIT